MPRLDVDLFLFHLLNAGAGAPSWVIAGARFASIWMPGLCLLLVAIGLLARDPHWRRSMQMALLSVACAWLACRLIRWGVHAPRPAQLGIGIQWIKHGGQDGFPSLHAAGAFALAQSLHLSLMRHARWLPPLLWLLACAVALSRVALGVHFPSDILAGAALGCACAFCVRHVASRVGQWRARRRDAAGGVPPLPTSAAPAAAASAPVAAPME
jgi:undecaprenyl-diphosphatase